METSTTNRNPFLDILRCFAILSVVIFHYEGDASLFTNWFSDIRHTLWIGVDLFFVLSGFLIGEQWLKSIRNENGNFKKFYIKRIFRILPSYLLVLTLYIAHSLFVMKRDVPLWKLLFFLQNFDIPSLFVQSWSLCVEEHFYIFFPILSFVALKKFTNKTFTLTLLIAFCFPLFIRGFLYVYFKEPLTIDDWERRFYYPTYNHIEGIIAGILLADLKINYPQKWNDLKKRNLNFLLLGLFGAATTIYFLISSPLIFKYIYAFTFLGLSFAFITFGFSTIAWAPRKWFTPITILSELSFSLYLLFHLNQLGITILLKKINQVADPSLVFILVHATLLISALLLYYFWEKKFHIIKMKLISNAERPIP
jgi:peptidoglycan/LPS O-acetylase OafA/YrhL